MAAQNLELRCWSHRFYTDALESKKNGSPELVRNSRRIENDHLEIRMLRQGRQ